MKNNLTIKKPKISNIEFEHPLIGKAFDGYKILHLSDLHNKEFGVNQTILLKTTRDLQPDIILVTGDIIDRRNVHVDKAMNFFYEAVNIAPIYFSSGNHEYRFGRYDELKQRLIDEGVNVLNNEYTQIYKSEEFFTLIGVNDLDFFQSPLDFENTIKSLSQQTQGFKILMSHKPHKVEIYKESNVDLVLSGHAHGGQIRLPFIGGLFAPG
ncbi:MAG TPA: metallophosphoesterase, partial [Clostridia bacterium]